VGALARLDPSADHWSFLDTDHGNFSGFRFREIRSITNLEGPISATIISKFSEKPKLRITWWAMGLGLVTLFISPLLSFSVAVIVPAIAKTFGEGTSNTYGLNLGLIAFLLTIAALVVGSIALRKGERSWVLWLGFGPALLAGAFWLFMIIGELAFPH